MAENPIIEKAAEFENSDGTTDWQARWSVEMESSRKDLDDWQKRADKVVRRFLDDRKDSGVIGATRVNLFTANIQTMQALLFGKTPSVEVKRRFADPGDAPARVAGEILQRMLNTDIERDSDTYATALEMALSDHLLAGLGNVRVRYEYEEQEQDEVPAIVHPESGAELAPSYQPDPIVTKEEVEVDYVYWKDQRWSPCRNFDELRWWAYRVPMTRDDLTARFGEEVAAGVPLSARESEKDDYDGNKNNPWSRAEVWEIWSKEHKKVFWWVKGANKILDVKDDPLGLDGFFPSPRPLMANLTTSKLIPTPDFTLAQDIYDEVDKVSTRINELQQAIMARGVYDKTSDELRRLLSEGEPNKMIPVDNFAMFAEKGGLKGVVDWLPIDIFVMALDKLREYRSELMALLYQVTGMSDIMRGQSSGSTTATEQAIKAKFASVRMQARQTEFARFASEIMSLKAEIIAKHFSPETIVKRSNVEFMNATDKQIAQPAVQIIKTDVYQYRVAVKPEAISMEDYAAVKQERGEMLTSVATFLQSSMPVMQAAPQLTPMLLQLLQWAVAGFRGGATIEGAIDQAVVQAIQASQQPRPPQPDPEMMKAQLQAKMDMQKHQMDMQGKQMDLQMQGQKAQIDLGVAKTKAQIDLAKAGMEHQQAQADHELNIRQQEHQLQVDATKGALDQEMMQEKHKLGLEAAAAKAAQAKKNGAQHGKE